MAPTAAVESGPYLEDEVEFVAAFEGPAVEAGRINAKQLAPALFAMSELLERSADSLYGMGNALQLQVRANFRRGSFEFDLSVVPVAAVLGQQLLTNLSISDLQQLATWIGLVYSNSKKTLFSLILEHGSAPVTSVQPVPETLDRPPAEQQVNITIQGDNNVVTITNVPRPVAQLYTTTTVREAAQDVVEPVGREGIERFRIGDRNRPALVVSSEDVPKFIPPEIRGRILSDSTSTTAVELIAPNFQDGNKWRVAQGGEPFWVKMMDEQFNRGVDRGAVGFHKGDFLIVDLRTVTTENAGRFLVEREVIKVHRTEQRSRNQQGRLDFGT